jgi:hypothetical protein
MPIIEFMPSHDSKALGLRAIEWCLIALIRIIGVRAMGTPRYRPRVAVVLGVRIILTIIQYLLSNRQAQYMARMQPRS